MIVQYEPVTFKAFLLEKVKLTIKNFNLLISFRHKSGMFAVNLNSFLICGLIRRRQHSAAEHYPLPRDPLISGATEYHKM
jgi:hypothetical protein